jgi:hypothetical protein
LQPPEIAGTKEALAHLSRRADVFSPFSSFGHTTAFTWSNDLFQPGRDHSRREVDRPFSFWRNDMSIFADNAARYPLQVGNNLAANPGRVNDVALADLEAVAKVLLRAGQRKSLETVVLADGVSANAKGAIARALDKHKQNLH